MNVIRKVILLGKFFHVQSPLKVGVVLFEVYKIMIPSIVLTNYVKLYESLFENPWNSSNEVI